MANLEQFIQNMVNMCNDNSYGYRLGGWGPKDYDCASSIITALRNAGFDTDQLHIQGIWEQSFAREDGQDCQLALH